MHQSSLWLLGSVLVTVFFFYQLFRNYQTLRDVPGPFWAKLTDLQRLFWVKSLRSHKIYQKLHEEYGDCVRIGPNIVSL